MKTCPQCRLVLVSRGNITGLRLLLASFSKRKSARVESLTTQHPHPWLNGSLFDLSEKVKYNIMHADAKEKLGIQLNNMCSGSKSDSKEKKLERDRLRQKEIRRGENQKKIGGRANAKKLKEILYNKEMKLSEMKNKTEDLKSELLVCDLETHAVEKMLKEKEKLEFLMKEKFKMGFKHHSGCNNK